MLEMIFFVYTEHAKFQKASFDSNWDVKQWNKMFGIDTFTSPRTFYSFFAVASSGWGKGVDPKLFVSSCTTCRWGEDLGECYT